MSKDLNKFKTFKIEIIIRNEATHKEMMQISHLIKDFVELSDQLYTNHGSKWEIEEIESKTVKWGW